MGVLMDAGGSSFSWPNSRPVKKEFTASIPLFAAITKGNSARHRIIPFHCHGRSAPRKRSVFKISSFAISASLFSTERPTSERRPRDQRTEEIFFAVIYATPSHQVFAATASPCVAASRRDARFFPLVALEAISEPMLRACASTEVESFATYRAPASVPT